MVTKLIGRTGAVTGSNFVIPGDCSVLRIGAGPLNEIRIIADGVSRDHARIVRRVDGCWVEDAGSSNGTFINGLRLKAEKLRHLDVVTLGRRVDLIFVQVDQEGAPAPGPTVLSASLEFLSGPAAGTTVDVPLGELTLGRSPSCNVMVSHPSIGKTHARITRTDAQVTIEDLHSANGTFVNDHRISVEVLRHDDRIALAGVAQLRMILRADFWVGTDAADKTGIEPVYDAEWKTRYVWSPTELVAIERNEAMVLDLMEQGSDPESRAASRAPRPPAVASVGGNLVPPSASAVPTPGVPSSRATGTNSSVAAIQSVELTGGPDGSVVLQRGRHAIGRGAAADVHLADDDRGASRVHAVLTISVDLATLEDRSINGTSVNGERVKEPRTLRDGDEVRCGGSTFIVRLVR